MLLEIIQEPNLKLRQVSAPVDVSNGIPEEITKLISDMAETMYSSAGVGLCAIQVNKPVQVIIFDVTQDRGKVSDFRAFINPKLFYTDGTEYEPGTAEAPNLVKKGIKTINSQEGCLSVPFVFDVLQRAEELVVKFINVNGQEDQLHLFGEEALCMQHEYDHMHGILFTDRLSRLKLAAHKKNKGKAMITAGRRMINAINTGTANGNKLISLM